MTEVWKEEGGREGGTREGGGEGGMIGIRCVKRDHYFLVIKTYIELFSNIVKVPVLAIGGISCRPERNFLQGRHIFDGEAKQN